MKIEIYLSRDFILRIGEHTTSTYIILDGHVTVYGLYNNESLGILGAGSSFGNDIGLETAEIKRYKFGDGYKSELRMNSESDNFESKSPVHLAASTFVVVA